MGKRRIVLLFAAACLLSACGQPSAPKTEIPEGCIEKAEFFDPKGFRDYTDYCRYVYPSDFCPDAEPRYHPVEEPDVERLKGYFADFRGWMETEKRLGDYDFDPDCIGPGDYVRIETREGTPIGTGTYGKYDCYTVYFFDTESHTLFYIHQNS